MKLFVLIISILFTSLQAQATPVLLLTLKSEANPTHPASLGVDVDSNNKITRIYYITSEKVTKYFSPAQLTTSQTLVTKSDYKLVTIRALSFTNSTASLKLIYNKNVLDDTFASRYFSIKFNPSLNKYEIYDEKQRQFSKAYVTTHRNNFFVSVGIDEIQTQ